MPKSFAKFLTEEEMTRRFGITKDQLKRLRTEKGLPHIELNQQIKMYPEKAISAWLESQVVPKTPK